MHNNSDSNRGRRGSAMFLYLLMLPVLILITGLAIDVTMQYIVQAQLQTAVDGAARGAMRLLGTGANTTQIANEYLAANMPKSFWFSNTVVPNISYTSGATSETIIVTATTQVPTFFLQYLGVMNTTVAAGSVQTARNLVPCALSYPSGSPPALSSVAYAESIDVVGFGPNFVTPHGQVMVWYTDEHALTLGVHEVDVITLSGKTKTTTKTTYPFTFFSAGVYNAVSATTPLPVGTTALTGQQAGTDIATWNKNYNYLDHGRPLWPALFLTDITNNANDKSGDWQQGNLIGIAPNAVYGTWKGAVRTVDTTTNPFTITVTPDIDPAANGWTGVPDSPPGGFPKCDGWCSEVVWNMDSLGLRAGHTYRMQLMIHDGDQHGTGGDAGEACVIMTN